MQKLILGLAVAGAIISTGPVNAAAFTVNIGSVFPVPGNNDFQANLAGLGLTNYTTVGASITLNHKSKIRFDYMGSESGFVDSFKTGSLPIYAEYNKSSWGPVLIGVEQYAAGLLTDLTFTTSGDSLVSTPGVDSFGIFSPIRSGSFSSNVIYFGFDDQINNIDDNHDDFIIRATAVPEPASWALMVIGFGLIGVSTRRRTVRSVVA